MILTVPHHKTRQQAIEILNAAPDLFSGVAGPSIEIVDEKREWTGSRMAFSFTGKVGFIAVPVSGTIDVDDVNITVMSDLPPMVRTYVGDDKVASGIEKQLRRLL